MRSGTEFIYLEPSSDSPNIFRYIQPLLLVSEDERNWRGYDDGTDFKKLFVTSYSKIAWRQVEVELRKLPAKAGSR